MHWSWDEEGVVYTKDAKPPPSDGLTEEGNKLKPYTVSRVWIWIQVLNLRWVPCPILI